MHEHEVRADGGSLCDPGDTGDTRQTSTPGILNTPIRGTAPEDGNRNGKDIPHSGS